MHFAHITRPGPFRLTPGQTYLMDDRPAGQYLMAAMADHIWHTDHSHSKPRVVKRHQAPLLVDEITTEEPVFDLDKQEFHPMLWPCKEHKVMPKGGLNRTSHDLVVWCPECENAGKLTSQQWPRAMQPMKVRRPFRLLIVRAGGLGDLLMITPSLVELQRRHPGMAITVATTSAPALTLPSITTIPYPIPLDALAEHDLVIPLEGYIEDNTTHTGATVFAHALGLLPTLDSPPTFPLAPIYHLDPALQSTAWQRFPRDTSRRHRIGIQIRASADNRTYPVNQLGQLMDLLIAWNCEIYLFANPTGKQTPQMHPQIINLPCLEDAPDFAQSAGILSTMDLVIAPDSALCHLAGALSLPTIALFGPFHWRTRTAHTPTTHALQGPLPCSPCHHHGWPGDPYPAGHECVKKQHCLALAAITPERILAKIKQMLPSQS